MALLGEHLRPMAEFLESAGYTDDLVRNDYPVWGQSGISRFNVAAFGRSIPKDMSTLTVLGRVVIEADREPVLSSARDAGAPVALLSIDGLLEIWSIRAAPEEPQRIQVEREEDARRLGERFRDLLGPEALLAAKTTGRQLTLFPIDVAVLARAREHVAQRLSDRMAQAMTQLLTGDQTTRGYRLATRTVMGALAALMIRDKDHLEVHGAELFDAAKAKFPSYFAWWDHETRHALDVESALQEIGEGVDFENLDPFVVGRLYEEVLVRPENRAKAGIYYTPLALAKRLLATIPLELLPPERRHVFDPTCGSGSLLLAAYERLDELLPQRWNGDERHRYLVSHLAGADRDDFAVELARLSLLLRALPVGDSWELSQWDALLDELPTTQRPSVVVGNPPWGSTRSLKGRRHERATEFLDRMLDIVEPGGYVGAILPASWLNSDVAAESRERTRERADIVEVWWLPTDTFPSSKPPPCVVVLQAKAPTKRPWLFKRVATRAGLATFELTGVAEEAWLSVASSGRQPFLAGPFDHRIKQLDDLPRLDSVAQVRRGPVPKKIGDVGRHGGEYLYLREARELPAYGVVSKEKLGQADYPGDFNRAGRSEGPSFRFPKVLVSAVSTPGAPWRMKASLDRVGVIPRESLYIVRPLRADVEDDLFALLAILGSTVANAWIGAHEAKRSITKTSLAAMPIPQPGSWPDLAKVGRALSEAGSQEQLARKARAADSAVARAYGLDPDVATMLNARFFGAPSPEGGVRYEHVIGVGADAGGSADGFVTYGVVIDVYPPLVRLWAAGLTSDDGEEIFAPAGFLGGLSEPGAGFDMLGASELKRATFRAQRRAYELQDAGPTTIDT